jgi:hypothetical protein
VSRCCRIPVPPASHQARLLLTVTLHSDSHRVALASDGASYDKEIRRQAYAPYGVDVGVGLRGLGDRRKAVDLPATSESEATKLCRLG